MKSIKEYNTSGMNIAERYDLFEKVVPIQIGEIVWFCGDCWEYPTLVKVTEDNQKEVTMFWNSLYFEKEENAIYKNNEARMGYNHYMSSTWR